MPDKDYPPEIQLALKKMRDASARGDHDAAMAWAVYAAPHVHPIPTPIIVETKRK